MNKILKYFIITSVTCLLAFTAYVKWKEIDNKKPTIYIDNYTGSSIEIKYRNKNWIQLKDENSIMNRDLKQGTYFLHIKNMDTSAKDTIRIDIKEKKKYVLNLFQGTSYYEGEISYQKISDPSNHTSSQEVKIDKIFFETKADFVLEKPSNNIKIWSKNKSPKYFNTSATKKYLRRVNQNW